MKRPNAQDRPLPHDIGAEQGLIGCYAMSRCTPIEPAELARVESTITLDHFYREHHALIYDALRVMFSQGAKAPDCRWIRERVERGTPLLDEEESGYLDHLLASEPCAAGLSYFADRLHRAFLRRRLMLRMFDLSARAQREDSPIGELREEARGLALGLEEGFAPGGPPMLSYREIVTGEVPPVEWVVEQLVPKEGITMIAGDPGVGKSWLAYHIAQCVALDLPVLGQFATRQCGVLILDTESGRNLLSRRMTKLHRGLSLSYPSCASDRSDGTDGSDAPLSVVCGAIRLDEPSGLAELGRRIEEARAGLVIIDPLAMVHGLDENSSTEMAGLLGRIGELARERGCTLLIVHHARKQSQVSNDAGQRLRGSSAIRGALSSYLFLRKLRSGRMQVEQAKSREEGEVPAFEVELADLEGDAVELRYVGESSAKADRTQAALDFVLRALADAGGSLPRKDLIELAKVEGIAQRAVDRALRGAAESGELCKMRTGLSVSYRLPEPSLGPE